MSKQKNLFIFTGTIFLLSFIAFGIGTLIAWHSLSKTYKFTTSFENTYASFKLWWIFLIFVPLYVIPLVSAIKSKNKKNCSSIVVLMVLTTAITFGNLSKTKKYSTETETLIKIEREFACEFPNDATILINEKERTLSQNKNAKVLGEGVIRFSQTAENLQTIENFKWQDSFDDKLKEYLPTEFLKQMPILELRYVYCVNEENIMTFLAYDAKNEVIQVFVVDLG